MTNINSNDNVSKNSDEQSTEALLEQFCPTPMPNAHEVFYRAGWNAALSQKITPARSPLLRFTCGLVAGIAASVAMSWMLREPISKQTNEAAVAVAAHALPSGPLAATPTNPLKEPERLASNEVSRMKAPLPFPLDWTKLWLVDLHQASDSIPNSSAPETDPINQSIAQFESRQHRGKQYTASHMTWQSINEQLETRSEPPTDFHNATLRNSVVREQLIRELN